MPAERVGQGEVSLAHGCVSAKPFAQARWAILGAIHEPSEHAAWLCGAALQRGFATNQKTSSENWKALSKEAEDFL